jgi:P-type Ca2+ transporter type 2C
MENYRLTSTDVLKSLSTDPEQGLDQTEAAVRLRRHGPNLLVERGRKGRWLILWEQLTSVMVAVLVVAAVVSLVLGDYKDAVVIGAIVLINTALGFTQEYRAEKAMSALKRMTVPTVRVRRSGRVQELTAGELVPGDIVQLEAGNVVPADGRLVESINLRIQEAALTGESEPVEKDALLTATGELPLGDRRNMAYMGTVVTYGRGQLAVTATGMDTELGAVADLIQTVSSERTPLQQRLDQLGRRLAVVALGIVVVIFALGLVRGEELKLMFLTAVGMAVAAVPEGLAAVVTIALALGAQRMLRRRALIRRLAAVETLGSVTVICSDKTGTLTQNRMTVTVLDVAGHRRNLDLAADSEDPSLSPSAPLCPGLTLLLAGGALCNDALMAPVQAGSASGPGTAPSIVGDPTEAALVVAAARMGLHKGPLERAMPRVAEVPFDSARKLMTTVHAVTDPTGTPEALRSALAYGDGQYLAFTKGAVDRLLDESTSVWSGADGAEPLTESWRQRISAANDQLAGDGSRVLGLAFRRLESPVINANSSSLERDMVFVGLFGMIDPPRAEVRQAVATCAAAGIRPVMITGDHPLTASFIARDLGIAQDDTILTGQQLDQLSGEELEAAVGEVAVYARVSPEHKLKIVQALQKQGHIVAMTGDGVNDAPALKKADIGVAMGITGTDVSKEAADMVLLDDNFSTIVAAVEEGRVIYDNIRKFIKYLLTTNSAEVWLMLLAPFLGMPLPLLPLQILWINLVTDGFPALALGLEPAEHDTMHRPPYRPGESVFSRGIGRHIVWVGLLMGLLSLGTGYVYWRAGNAHWQTMVFTTLALSQMAHVMGIRSGRESLFRLGLLSNKPLLAAVLSTLLLQVGVIYLPVLQSFFRTTAVPLPDLLLSVALSSLVFAAVELEKWWTRTRSAAAGTTGRRPPRVG